MAEQDDITERLKAEPPMIWVGSMNNIHDRVEENIKKESFIPNKHFFHWHNPMGCVND